MTSTDLTVHAIAAQRWKIGVTLSVLMLVIYFGVILLVAFSRSFLLVLLAPGLSVGILLNAVTIVACGVLFVIYVAWANGGMTRRSRMQCVPGGHNERFIKH